MKALGICKPQQNTRIMTDEKMISFTPELPIGTEFYIMKNNTPSLGLIAAINVKITTLTTNKGSWHKLLFSRWNDGKQKEIWEYTYGYEVKLLDEIFMYEFRKIKNSWWLLDYKVYFSLDELKKDLAVRGT